MRRVVLLFFLIFALAGCSREQIPSPTTTSTAITTTTSTTTTTDYVHIFEIRGFVFPGASKEAELLFSTEKYGANYLQVNHWIQISRETGELISFEDSQYAVDEETESEEANRGKIIEGHKYGFGIILQLYPEWYGTRGSHFLELPWGPLASGEARETFKQQYLQQVAYWAQIAKNYNVEIFSPVCELIVFLPADEAKEFYGQIAATAEAYYSGLLAPKTEVDWYKYDNYNRFPAGTTMDDYLTYYEYTGYDFVEADLFGGYVDDVTNEATYRNYLDLIMTRCETLEGLLGLQKTICTEVGFPDYFDGNTASYEAKRAIVEALFDRTKGRADGLIIWYGASLIPGTDDFRHQDLLQNVIKPLFEEAQN